MSNSSHETPKTLGRKNILEYYENPAKTDNRVNTYVISAMRGWQLRKVNPQRQQLAVSLY